MKTKYSPLVQVKKNIMQKSERVLQSTNAKLYRLQDELKSSIVALDSIVTPSSGKISEFLSSKTLLESQRLLIQQKEALLFSVQEEMKEAKAQLKVDMIEYEKFNYLDLQERKEFEERKKREEAKELDEVALLIYSKTAQNKEKI